MNEFDAAMNRMVNQRPLGQITFNAGWLALAFLLALLVGGCAPDEPVGWAIRLLEGDMATADFMAAGLDELALQDRPLLDGDDLVRYDPATHQMELTPAAFRRLRDTYPLPVDVDGIPFVVTVGEEPIYRGALWTPLSSLSFDGVVIMQPMVDEPPVIGLALGYPGPDFATDDPRDDGRVIDALGAAGKIR
jgi:hypothetical protein